MNGGGEVTSYLNAPSREQIYKTVMQMSEGSNWTYDYEEFVRFDAVSRNTAAFHVVYANVLLLYK